jgi:carbonic anhydrase
MAHDHRLFGNNRAWADRIRAVDPEFFHKLTRQQSPEFLWIGCADSRVPANEIVGLMPGEMFVHRNVANVVVHTDLNCLSVIHYAIEVLHIKEILVVGHYGCGGISAALANGRLGLIDNWLRHVQDVMRRHEELLARVPAAEARARLLCELNVIEQVSNVCQSTVVQSAWDDGRELTVRGWIYDLADGLLQDLAMRVGRDDDPARVHRSAVAALERRL